MERAKAYERLNRYEEAIESYARTIELDDDLLRPLRIGK
jgi:tetratricopeptide (TPR) repeat protein